jgi:Na+/melibiose symporter-like transporter
MPSSVTRSPSLHAWAPDCVPRHCWRRLYIGITGRVWNFVIRGIALVVLAALLACAAWAQRARDRADRDSLSQKLDLAIARNRGLRRAAFMGVVMCTVAAVFGVGGYFVRVRLGHPPAMSPLEPLTLLSVMAGALLSYLHFTAKEEERLRYLKGVLASE